MIPQRFCKKPVEIEAMRWPGADNCASQDVLRWGAGSIDLAPVGQDAIIWTRGWTRRAVPGDWIVKDEWGDFYPCKADIFDATYERVEAGAPA